MYDIYMLYIFYSIHIYWRDPIIVFKTKYIKTKKKVRIEKKLKI